MATQTFTIDEEQRLDSFLSQQLSQTRSQIAQLIKQNAVKIDGKPTMKPGQKLKPLQEVEIIFPELKETQPLDVDFDVEVLYEDDDLLVINKPSGLTVHPAPSVQEATLVDWLKHKGIRLSTISGEERHGIVHRLDKGTSGVMVVAKTNEVHEALSLQLQDKSMGRFYLAITNLALKEELTTVDAPIARSSHNRLKMAIQPHGKQAKTEFKKTLLSRDENFELLTCKLFTGRTHQIRVHLEKLNRYIIGDHLYGSKEKKEKSERILLHAYILYFVHPTTKKREHFIAPLDKEMLQFIEKNFDLETFYETIQPDNIKHGFSVSA
jgi:23S rRNA pseudouridine1911/1915/1917 synthase